ncbi:filaggrin-2-like isoform X3 [Palaemon carinicauda]|uniref:filaggrin-2-like isoform X3 n=1 Tax=Palaemon carinicauda TaxID=392227 RepID=UPI0035B5E645
MIFHKIILLSLLVAVASAAPAETRSLDYILANLTSLWEEVNQLKREVNFHVHDGDMDHEHDLDQTLDEVAALAHEHHVHHLKHPHEGHNEHHNEYLLQHLETAHGHGDHGSSSGKHSGSHGMTPGHGSHGMTPGRGSHGMTPGRGSSSSYGGSHGYDSGEDDDSHEEDSSYNPGPGPSPPHRRGHGGYGYAGHGEHGGHGGHSEPSRHSADDDSHEDDHSFHGLDINALGHVSSDARHYEPDHYARSGTSAGSARLPAGASFDDWKYAQCNLMPNADMPRSQVNGEIDMSQKAGGRNVVYFDIDVSGLDLTRDGRIYSLHVHERPAVGQRCDTAGGYNRPSVAALSRPTDHGDEHAGNLGTYTVDDDGEIDHKIVASLDVTFEEVIGKAIVVHNQSNERLACCNVVNVPGHGRY